MSILLAGSDGMEDALAHAEHGAALYEAQSFDLDVPTSTLSAVLDRAGVRHIDLLSLDVEGHETDVLKGLDFDRHAPRYILIEILDEQSGKAPVYDLLEPRYELVEQLSVRDHLFRLR